MTLSTDIYVLDQVDVPELFRFCQGLLAQFDDRSTPQQPDQQKSRDREGWREDGARCMSNEIGQGLPAILDIHYRPNAALATAEQAAQCTSDCDDPEEGEDRYHHHPHACWVNIDFDTTYGYRDSAGRGCGDLHAALVALVGKWCDERGARWEWRNEYTGDIHGGETRYERLLDLMKQGSEAAAWFRNSVLPAIATHIVAQQARLDSAPYAPEVQP
jgi:hypothetical protein